jgi:hypothetical protein
MAFFKQFPSVIYDLDKKGHKVQVKDIFRFIDVNEKLIDGASAYQYYYIKDGERPDHVAAKLYKNAEFYWTFFVVNDFLKQGYNTWPLSYQQLQTQIKTDYQPYSVLEMYSQDNTKISSNNTSPRSLYFGFYDLPHGQGKPSRLSPNNWSPAIADGKVFKYDEEKGQLWIENQSQRLKNHVAKSGHGPLNMQAFTSDSKVDTRIYNFKKGYQYAWQAPNYFKDSNEEEVSFYDASSDGGNRVLVSFPNFLSADGEYVQRIANNGQVRWGHTEEGSYGNGLTILTTGREDLSRYIFFDTSTNQWSFFQNNSIQATLPISITESAGWWTASPTAWGGSFASNLSSPAYQFFAGSSIGGTLVTNREQIEDENEKRTKIRVVKPQHIAEFAELYKRLVRL